MLPNSHKVCVPEFFRDASSCGKACSHLDVSAGLPMRICLSTPAARNEFCRTHCMHMYQNFSERPLIVRRGSGTLTFRLVERVLICLPTPRARSVLLFSYQFFSEMPLAVSISAMRDFNRSVINYAKPRSGLVSRAVSRSEMRELE